MIGNRHVDCVTEVNFTHGCTIYTRPHIIHMAKYYTLNFGYKNVNVMCICAFLVLKFDSRK
jgi:hypothetical protein